MDFPLIDLSTTRDTKERILLVAVQLFAKRGYTAVSVRDIAELVGIKASSLYYHYASKDEIFTDILGKIESVYNDYYIRLDRKITQAATLEDMIKSLFDELRDVYHMFIYYGVTVLSVEQFRDDRARLLYNDVYMRRGIEYMSKAFDYCVEKQWTDPFETKVLATMIMNCVANGSLMRALQGMGYEPVYSASEMFKETEGFVLATLQRNK